MIVLIVFLFIVGFVILLSVYVHEQVFKEEDKHLYKFKSKKNHLKENRH